MRTLVVGLLGVSSGAVLAVIVPLVISILASFRAFTRTTGGGGMGGINMSMTVPTIVPIAIGALVG
jgi:hypothetical protein